MEEQIAYTIERSRNRHSRAFVRDGTVVIRLARRLSMREEQIHIEHLLSRMIKAVKKDVARTRIDPFRTLLHGASADVITVAAGRQYRIELHASAKTSTKRIPGGFRIGVPPNVQRKSLHRFLWNLIATEEVEFMEERLHLMNTEHFQTSVTRVTLRHMQTQWGSCSMRGRITLNAALMFVPQQLLDYVLAHELAHRHHANHSRAFWNTVAIACPDYAEKRKALNQFKIGTL